MIAKRISVYTAVRYHILNGYLTQRAFVEQFKKEASMAFLVKLGTYSLLPVGIVYYNIFFNLRQLSALYNSSGKYPIPRNLKYTPQFAPDNTSFSYSKIPFLLLTLCFSLL